MTRIFLPYSQIEDPGFAQTPLGQLVNGARSAACALYSNAPNWAIADPTGIGSITKSIWDAICDSPNNPLPQPVPIQPPIAGGRCECIEYQIVVQRQSQGVPQSNIVFNVFGPVSVRGWVVSPVAGGNYDYRIDHGAPQCGGATFTNIFANVLREDIRVDYTWAEVLSVTRLDGQADNCGGQPPIYPPQVPSLPFLNPVVNIDVAPSVTIPVGLVFVKPSFNVDVGGVGINLFPSFNVDISPDVNVNIGFNIGGVNINFSPRQLPPGQQPTLPPTPSPDPRQPPPKLPPGIDNDDCDLGKIEEKLRKILERLAELEECACPSFEGLSPQLLGEGNSLIASLPENSRWIRVEILQLPPNARSWNGLSAPSPVTAGWAWFSYSNGEDMGDRAPLDSMSKAFEVPRGAKRFAFTVYTGGVARAVCYRKV